MHCSLQPQNIPDIHVYGGRAIDMQHTQILKHVITKALSVQLCSTRNRALEKNPSRFPKASYNTFLVFLIIFPLFSTLYQHSFIDYFCQLFSQ